MTRAIVFAALWLAATLAASLAATGQQPLSVLHIKVVVIGTDGNATPVPRHMLLVSDNPSTAPPKEIVTALDGTVDVRLRPGNYTVESDRPVVFQGRAYQWTQTLDIPAGRDTVLELNAGNAEVETAAAATTSGAPPETDPAFLLVQWQGSVVTLWTETMRASGFLVDQRGLVATSQHVVGPATSVEVQLSPTVKVAARVLASDATRDVAVLWIDAMSAASTKPVPLACTQRPAIAAGQALYTIDSPLRAQKGMASGKVSRVEAHAIAVDLMLSPGSLGAPVFAAGGAVAGIASTSADRDAARGAGSHVVPVGDVCDVVAAADKKMTAVAAPEPAHLPLEPERPFPIERLRQAVERRAGSLNPYQMSSTDFDLAFITPLQIYGAQYQAEQIRTRDRQRSGRTRDVEPGPVRPLLEFANWSDYMADLPPVLLVRVTPKLVENFWTTVARGAARTQGVALPPVKRVKAGFARMRAFCGDAEVTPIHPFKIEQRVGESDAIYEGLYVFDPAALGPDCGAVKLTLYSDKQPDKADTAVVDPKIVQQVWTDFASYREP